VTSQWCQYVVFAGSINATVHREVIKDHATHFNAGTVIVLRQVSAATYTLCIPVYQSSTIFTHRQTCSVVTATFQVNLVLGWGKK